jgi:hypothetical protein
MALTEKDIYTWSVTEDRHIQVLRTTVIMRNGEEIGRVNHRHVLEPGDDTANEHAEVANAANVVWTEEVKNAWEAKKQALENRNNPQSE